MFGWRSGAVLVGTLCIAGGFLGACDGANGTVSGPTDTDTFPPFDAASPEPMQSDTSASQMVTSSGAIVATTTGVAVEIPTGALGFNVFVSLAASPASTPPESTTLAGTPFTFGPSGLQFARPVTVVLRIDRALIPPGKTEADVVIYTAPEGTLEYTALPTKLRDITHVEATTTHFSVFLPAVPVTATDAAAPDGGPDAGEPDAGAPDAGEPDADAGEPDADAGEPDADVPDADDDAGNDAGDEDADADADG